MSKRLLLILPFLLSGCFNYSDGDYTGVVTRLSRKGYFCKTWEGEINLGGMREESQTVGSGKHSSSVTTMVANIRKFTVEDKDAGVIPDITLAMETGKPVTLHYRKELVSFCRSDSGSYFVNSIK